MLAKLSTLSSFSFILLILFSMSACSRLPQQSVYKQAPTKQQARKIDRTQRTERTERTTKQTPRKYTHSQQQPSSRPQVFSQPRNQQYPLPQKIHPARLRMINVAQSVVGVPYKWGGNNPQQGFDCSGFTRFVHKNALGMTIPRVTAQQRDNSRTINYSQLQAGDMLFFKTSRTSNHVGIYIGNRKFIHAPSSGKRVSVATMDSAYWHKRFVKFGTFL